MKHIVLVAVWIGLNLLVRPAAAEPLESQFRQPPVAVHPETWFHLIGGNVSKSALTIDLEAVSQAGISGIQLFHGKGRPWPGVSPQIPCLSGAWDDMIGHIANETRRLGLRFTMQNCPGWAMSGGPWITPDRAMRHLIWSRQDVDGGRQVTLQLARPEPSQEPWRDYRDIAVVAFPAPLDDTGGYLQPVRLRSNDPDLPFQKLLQGRQSVTIAAADDSPVWLEVTFDRPVCLRSIELPPVEILMKRVNFSPDSHILLQAVVGSELKDIRRRAIPRGTWQDRQPEMPLVLAFDDVPARTFRMTFQNRHPMELTYLRLSSAARVNDWRGQAGYALRSLDRSPAPRQDPAAWIDSSTIVDLTAFMDASGRVTWDAPSGRWTLLRFGHVNTGVKNKPAPPEATGFECDKLSPAGAEQHFAGYIGRITAPGGPADGGRLQGMLIDSWECYTQTWTDAMEREFAARRRYPLRLWLPVLTGRVVDSHADSERFLRDWRATISDLLVDCYFGRLAELARRRGMKLSFETALGDVSPGDILQYYSRADIPMCEFWQPNDPHWGGFEAKPIHPAVSAAHIYGKPRVAAESFTNIGIRWNEHPFMLKHRADQHFALGVNHLVFHTYTHNPRLDVVPGTSFGGRIGTPFLRGQTWWRYMPLFTDYLARCQLLLQQGRPVADVLWYLGDDLDHKPRQDTPFPSGYQFDYVNFDALSRRIRVIDGKLTTPEGLYWRVLWLADVDGRCQRLTPQTLVCLENLLRAGAVVVGAPPRRNASLSGGGQADERFEQVRRRLWGDPGQPSGDRRIGAGRLVWGGSLASHLQQLEIRPDVVGARSATWCHRRTADTDIYFISADRAAPLDANLRFRSTGRPWFWDPLTGRTRPAAVFSRQGGYTSIPVRLPAAGSRFVLFRNNTADNYDEVSIVRIEHNGHPWLDAADADRIDRGRPYPPLGLSRTDPVQPWIDPPGLIADVCDNGRAFLAWRDGVFRFVRSDRSAFTLDIRGTRSIPLDGQWTLSFPPGWGAPSSITLQRLAPWSSLPDPPVRAFSGTGTYQTQFELAPLQPGERCWLDLGRVAHIAEIVLNDRPVATVWAPPFRADLTPYLAAAGNRLTVRVTNTWHNRLSYDAGLPENKRKTWTYSAPDKDAPLEPAGLLGPVVLRIGKQVELPPGPIPIRSIVGE